MTTDVNLRSTSYTIAQGETSCWKCRKLTPVFALFVPAGHEYLEVGDDDDAAWELQDETAVLSFVTYLASAVAKRVAELTGHYRLDYSKTAGHSYWMNHCEACGMKQGDFELMCEPEGAFFPMEEAAAAQILLLPSSEPFCAGADASYGDRLFEAMRRE